MPPKQTIPIRPKQASSSPPPPPIAYLFLGSGDFTSPFELAMKNSVASRQKMDRHGLAPDHPGARVLDGISLVATELRTQDDSIRMYHEIDKRVSPKGELLQTWDFQYRISGIKNMGGEVIGGFDATRFPSSMYSRSFDRIVFENPHSGRYGQEGDDVKNMQAVKSNRALLENVMIEARKYLARGGIFELSVCGWPYISNGSRRKEWDMGMDLGSSRGQKELGDTVGMQVYKVEDRGVREVSRNDGSHFRANVIRIKYVKNSR